MALILACGSEKPPKTGTERFACLLVLAALGPLGCGGKVAGSTRVVSTGGTAAGGYVSGGTTPGGINAGGYVSGGMTSGGVSTGGTATGGYETGGTATGGYVSGGTTSGGTSAGGAPAGGYVSGGIGTGGISTGGMATGGSAIGGTATGGRATGGTGGVAVCQTVTTLPEQGSSCGTTPGESRCLANGERCVCLGNAWLCNSNCANLLRPTPGDDCSNDLGALCSYADGATCACLHRWRCIIEGNSSTCPATPTSGDACNRPGLFCDYPGATHEWCMCVSDSSGANPTWTCVVSGSCPANQPVYPTPCTSVRFCTYGDVHCTCVMGGTWICGDWPFLRWDLWAS